VSRPGVTDWMGTLRGAGGRSVTGPRVCTVSVSPRLGSSIGFLRVHWRVRRGSGLRGASAKNRTRAVALAFWAEATCGERLRIMRIPPFTPTPRTRLYTDSHLARAPLGSGSPAFTEEGAGATLTIHSCPQRQKTDRGCPGCTTSVPVRSVPHVHLTIIRLDLPTAWLLPVILPPGASPQSRLLIAVNQRG